MFDFNRLQRGNHQLKFFRTQIYVLVQINSYVSPLFVNFQIKTMSSRFESFSTEVLYEIFDDLTSYDLFHAFAGLTRRFDAALTDYSVRLNMRCMSRYAFDRMCSWLQAKQIVSLILSDYDRSPSQVELFLKSVQVEQMENLRSLTLINGDSTALSSILVRLPCTKLLQSLTLVGCRKVHSLPTLTTLDQVTNYHCMDLFLECVKSALQQICHLSIDSCTNEEIQQICLLVPQLKNLSIKCTDIDLPKLDQLSSTLTKLNLIIPHGK
jgi:hypothetical protein